jgi:heterodisulfide reductase subunit A-like polyferredoxin
MATYKMHAFLILSILVASILAMLQPLTTDVCIIGGGSSGTYAAIRLHDLGKKVIVVEQQAHLGGHTNTYVDPSTNRAMDYGVRF